jgi:uncharacterized membrane protein
VSDPVPNELRDRRVQRDRGAVLQITAILIPVLLTMTAFAVDLGSQRALRRTMQARADIVALDMVRLADGRTEAQILGDPGYAAYLSGTAARNEVDTSRLTIAYGTVNDILDANGNVTGATPFIETLASGIPNAVKVTGKDQIDYVFRPGTGKAERSAVARRTSLAGFSIGSFAAGVQSGSGPLLNRLIGNALGLGVLSYDGLAATNLTYLGLATELGFGTAEELLDSDVSAFDALTAAAQIMQRNNVNAAQLTVLNQVLAVPNSPLRDVSIADIVTVEAGGEKAAAVSSVNVFDILTTAAFISNGDSGISVPATSLGLPFANLTGSLNLIQHPQTAFGPVGTHADTAQAGLQLGFTLGSSTICASQANLLANLLTTVTNLLTILLGAPSCQLLNKLITVDFEATVTMNLASARGTIDRIACSGVNELDIGVRSDLVSTNLTLTAVVKAGNTTIANVPLTASAGGGASNGAAFFDLPPDQYDVFKPVNPGNGSLGLDTLNVQGLGALGSLLTPIVNPVLTTTISTLNSSIILPLSNALGLRVAGADVAPRAVTCGGVQLVG